MRKVMSTGLLLFLFFFNDTATTEIYTTANTLSLHDALPIYSASCRYRRFAAIRSPAHCCRSEEHTSELQSLAVISYAVFCLKKKKNKHDPTTPHHKNLQTKKQTQSPHP